jgi:capsular polysaccharide transport system permease protein
MTFNFSFDSGGTAIGPVSDSFWANLKRMWRVIYALMIRESRTRYGGSDLGYLWALIDPLAQLIVLVLVFTAFGRRVPINATLPVFFTTGILPYQFWHGSTQRGATAAQSNKPLLAYPQVRVLDVILARVLLDAATLVVVFAVYMTGLHYVTGEPFSSWFGDPPQMVLAFSSLLYFTIGFAVFSAGISRVLPVWPEIFSYLGRPLWFLSGIYFTLQGLDSGFRKIALFNPIAHQLEWIKSAMLPGFHSTVYSPFYILSSATVALFIGLVTEWLWRLTGHPEGAE